MKQWITLLLATALLSSCSKQNLQKEDLQNNQSQSVSIKSGQEGAYVSGWEQYSDWQKSDEGKLSVFLLKRKTTEITSNVTNGGLVLSYAKIVTSDPLYISFNNPKLVPFYFLPESERPYPQTFYVAQEVSEANITITYRVPFTKQTMPAIGTNISLQNVQFQYVILTKEFLANRGLTANTVRNNYTYSQVMSLINP